MTALRPVWSLVETHHWHMETVSTGWEAMERVQSGLVPHLLILDLARGDQDSLHVLRWLRRLRPDLPILLLCHAVDADKKEDAVRLGADEILVRPFTEEQLEHLLCRYLHHGKTEASVEVASEHIERLGENWYFVGVSPQMRKVRAQSELLAQADVPVLILGEPGSGKETTARLIHRKSVRSGFKFLKVNCGAVPGELLEKEIFGAEDSAVSGPAHSIAGKLDIAGKGILFLNEITSMPSALQLRLLEFMRTGRYTRRGSTQALASDARIVASANTNIERALAEKRLREDLYYRLSAFTVHVPPLRQRTQEIRILLRHFMNNLAKHYGLPARDFSESVIEACENYSWPGNLRELETFVKRYLVAGEEDATPGQVDFDHHERSNGADYSGTPSNGLSQEAGDDADMTQRSLKSLIRSVKSETERNAIGVALEKTGWNRKAAARLLKVSYRTLLYKIEQYHMNASESFVTLLPGLPSPTGSGKDKAS